jgi:CubicO group peptidase (beta-lactamase class C family)
MRYFIFLLLFPCLGHSQDVIPSHIHNELTNRVTSNINQGISVALIDSNNKANYFNYGTEGDFGDSVSQKTVFEIASISKTFTVTLYHTLERNGVITLTDEIRNFIPDSIPESIKQITFSQLINHTSGLPRLAPDFWTSDWDNPYSDYSQNRLFTDLMTAQVDSTNSWNYSNMAYQLLGVIADSFTKNQGLQMIISSLGLANTSAYKETQITTSPHNFGIKVSNWDFPEFNRYMGGIKSTTEDLTKYLGYHISYNPVFKPTEYTQNIIINKADSLVNKDGWLIFYRGNQQIIWHNGISGGFNSFIGYNMHTQKAIALVSNSQSSITDIGLNYLCGQLPLKHPKPALINNIQAQIQNEGTQHLKKTWVEYDSLKLDKNPINLYWLQCHYISNKEFKKALSLNTMLMTDYPADWELFFYRAKIYELMGHRSKSQKNYRKVESLFPENNFIYKYIKTK